MSIKHLNIILVAFLLVFCLIFGKSADSITAPADVYPKAIVTMIAVLAIILLLQTVITKKGDTEANPFAGLKFNKIFCTIFCTLLYYVGIQMLGFYVSSFLFLIGLILLLDHHKQKSWKEYGCIVLLCLVVICIIYLGFHVFLRVPTPAGWFV